MAKRIGRNDLCWCGSGKKFKKCHLDRNLQPLAKPWEVNTRHVAALSKPMCLHPEAPVTCNGEIIRAHTIQRNGGLSRIARDGHVYQTRKTDLFRLAKQGGRIVPTLQGIGAASTFTGFCGHHDDRVFAPLEKKAFSFEAEQCYLLAYRALCMALYAKIGHAASNELLKELDRGKSLQVQKAIQDHAKWMGTGIDLGLKDLQRSKMRYDKVLLSRDYSDVRYYAIELDRTPDILCSGFFSPERDFKNAELQNLADMNALMDQCGFSIIPTIAGGTAVFCWLQSPVVETFVQSLDSLDVAAKPHAVVRFAITVFENICLRPGWWEGLDMQGKEWVSKRLMMGVSEEHNTQDYSEDGFKIVNWAVTNTRCNYAM